MGGVVVVVVVVAGDFVVLVAWGDRAKKSENWSPSSNFSLSCNVRLRLVENDTADVTLIVDRNTVLFELRNLGLGMAT